MEKKKEIIKWFKADREFQSGLKLYMKHGNNLSFRTTLQRKGETKDTYNSLCYELAKTAGIHEQVYKNMLNQPLIKIEEKTEEPENKVVIEVKPENLHLLNVEELKYQDMVSLVSDMEIDTENRKKDTLIEALKEKKAEKLQGEIPENVQKTIKLREEFPFLKEKDCPEELKVLVADMLTAYDNYVEAHEQLFDTISEKEIDRLTQQVVENYIENQAIWKELNYYKEKKELLGKHPIFEWMKRKEKIEALSNADKLKLRDNLKNNIFRTKQKVEENPEHKNTAERKKRISRAEKELEFINTLFDA